MNAIPPLLAPKAGTVTQIDGHAGHWQIVAQSPFMRLGWAMPWSDDARQDPSLRQGHIKAHVIDIKHPTFTPGVSMATLRITRDGRVRDRQFQNLDEAIKFGVAYYLVDNGYCSRGRAKTAADKVRRGEAPTIEADDGSRIRFEVVS